MSLQEEVLRQHLQRQLRLGVIKSPPIIPLKINFQVPAGYRLVKIKKRGRKLNDQELLILNRLVREACLKNGGLSRKIFIGSRSRRIANERYKVFVLAKAEGLSVKGIARYFKCARRKIQFGIQRVRNGV